MLIWKGKGYLIFVIVFVISLLLELTTEAISGQDTFYQDHSWPLALALALSGAVIAFLSRKLVSEPPKTLIDKDTGEEYKLEAKHSLFFIKMDYWSYILIALSVLSLIDVI